jgi:type 1 glutamine amidotransferase
MTRHARACLILSLLIAPYASSAQNPALETAAKPLKVLFLGDQGHHRPADRFAQLQPVLATRGIDVVYTENLADLNPTKLKEFDALAVYANIERITPDAETAILDYVENGGGFVPLHCGSYCFLNSPRYVALVGAQFARHGTGIVTTNIVTPEHAVMKGITPFTTWDETYVHTKHNVTDRTVLQARKEGESDEPWTWVRTQGKGRVFYTAYGHDARAWGNPGFHDLVERGIRWAANKGSVQDSRPRVAKGLKPFEFVEAELPNYLAGERWGTIGEPIKKMQQPVSAEESQKHLVLPRGFEASLFASEPSIHKPICMAFDHRGRLWLAETVDYPNERQRAGSGRDRIAICEDTDSPSSPRICRFPPRSALLAAA